MELFKVKGFHVFSGEKFEMTILLRRRKGQRPIDAILSVVDLGGVHIESVKKIGAPRAPWGIVVTSTHKPIGRR